MNMENDKLITTIWSIIIEEILLPTPTLGITINGTNTAFFSGG